MNYSYLNIKIMEYFYSKLKYVAEISIQTCSHISDEKLTLVAFVCN